VAFVWELSKETLELPLGCLQGGSALLQRSLELTAESVVVSGGKRCGSDGWWAGVATHGCLCQHSALLGGVPIPHVPAAAVPPADGLLIQVLSTADGPHMLPFFAMQPPRGMYPLAPLNPDL